MKEHKMEASDLDAIIDGPEEIPPAKLPPALRASLEKEVKGKDPDPKSNGVYSKGEIIRYMERKRKE